MWLTIALIGVCAVGGGSPRTDPLSLLYLRPAMALLLAALIVAPGRIDLARYRTPAILLAAFAATMAIQLVPLPPAVWLALPGHERFAAAAEIAGIAQPWHPLSLVPMGTWNALAALLPAVAGLVAMAGLSGRERYLLVGAVLAVACVSAIVGTLQIASGGLYTYAVTSPGVPVGLFANRNHEAAFLAAALPLLAIWANGAGDAPSAFDRVRPWAALGTGLFLLVLLLVTGSRAGFALGLAGVVAAVALSPRPRLPRRYRRVTRVALVAAPGIAIVLAILVGRAIAIERLFDLAGTGTEQRLQALPTLLAMTRDFLPFGTGYGSFDPIFRVYELDSALHRSSFNHAHNDLVELALTGGVAGLAVLVAFLVWAGGRVAILWRTRRDRAPGRRAGWGGAATIAILLAASIVDYPLRTPFLSLLFAIATGWLAAATSEHAGLSRASSAAKPSRGHVDAYR